MEKILCGYLLLIFIPLAGCNAGTRLTNNLSTASHANASGYHASLSSIPNDHTIDPSPESVKPSQIEIQQIKADPEVEDGMDLYTEAIPRPPSETIQWIEISSRFGAIYNELYSLNLDTSIWQPVRTFTEGDFSVFQLMTIQPPSCTLEAKINYSQAIDIETSRKNQNRYRRMGTFISSELSFDVFYYTSSEKSLADTQHVIYILTNANGDSPYFFKPAFHAFSRYEDWEDCRSVVRSLLSTLAMRRVPAAN